MTTMTIKQAINRVESLKSNIEHSGNLTFMLKRDAARYPDGYSVQVYNGRYATMSLQIILDALDRQQAADKAEIEKLQPVIDMANAALKGVLS